MIDQSESLSSVANLRLPGWLLGLACAAGILFAAASLSYAPNGRLNVLWLWLLWAGLPLLGSVAAFWIACVGRGRPWVFQWRTQQLHWHPSPRERLQMMVSVQHLWLWMGTGILVGYLGLLLFTDLAFGWSSTLIDHPETIAAMSRALALPWEWMWPAAVPSDDLVAATRYARIDPLAGDPAQAGGWWSFLLMSLLCYNLLPRALLLVFLGLRLRALRPTQPAVGVQMPAISAAIPLRGDIPRDSLDHWQSAPALGWELADAAGRSAVKVNFGLGDWQRDEQTLRRYLSPPPERLRWQVNANRSPVAELSDLLAIARAAGVAQQGLEPITNSTTEPDRHLASWRAFARKHQLVWLEAPSP